MEMIPDKLREAGQKVYGPGKTRSVKMRTFLSWFGARRRGAQVTADIREALHRVGLKTEPDFMTANIEARIRLIPSQIREKSTVGPKNLPVIGTPPLSALNPTPKATVPKTAELRLSDPTPRVGTIFGGHPPVSVKRDATVREAVTIMVKNDFSQLPVMSSSRTVDGIISWKSIGESFHVHNKRCEIVGQCMSTDVEILRSNTPLWKAIKTIADNDIVLVQNSDKEIVGVVTPYDLASRYHTLAEPFLLVGEIENNLRQLIALADFPIDVLGSAKNPNDTKRTITSVSNLTFAEYVRLLEKPENWDAIHLRLSRTVFLTEIREIAKIRNEIMHFSPDPLESAKLATLRRVARMMRDFRLFETTKQ